MCYPKSGNRLLDVLVVELSLSSSVRKHFFCYRVAVDLTWGILLRKKNPINQILFRLFHSTVEFLMAISQNVKLNTTASTGFLLQK